VVLVASEKMSEADVAAVTAGMIKNYSYLEKAYPPFSRMGAKALPDLMSGARAFAEDAAKPEKPAKKGKGENADKAAKAGKAKEGEGAAAAVDEAADVSAKTAAPTPSLRPPAVCAPTAAELAKEAGLSPAELQVLQSLGARRGQLDQREQQLDVQLALLAAAEAKLDAKVRALTGLKADIKGLMTQADSKQDAEIDRLVKVFEAMKPKDAAPRMVLLDDSVRLPIAAKMKERSLSAIIAQMPPPEAKRLTESLSRRFSAALRPSSACSASIFSSSSRAACHSACVPTLCSAIALPPSSGSLKCRPARAAEIIGRASLRAARTGNDDVQGSQDLERRGGDSNPRTT